MQERKSLEREIDYFAVSAGLVPSTASVSVMRDTALAPHYPVKLVPKSRLVRTECFALAGPRRFPTTIPARPLPAPPDWSAIEDEVTRM
eukprot:4389658-Pyramimonas_sp.AAC.1